MWIAGVRAMYMQALHPRVMLGTWQNTALAKPDEAWGRFTRTVEFVRIRTYGTTAEVDRAGARLRKMHSSLTGVDADGIEFRLDEPELLLWVHCAEIGSYAEIARRSGVHVTRPSWMPSSTSSGAAPQSLAWSRSDRAGQHGRAGGLLRADAAQPAGVAEARHALRLSFAPKLPRALKPLRLIVPPVNVLAYASLPRWARRLYGTPAIGLTDAAVTLALRAAFESTTRIPPQLLLLPGASDARRHRAA